MIDIIIPAYNCRNTIEYTLNSIASQTYAIKNMIKCYIIDDCSNENYDDIICKFNFPIIYERLSERVKVGQVRQHGFNISNGDYVIFLDADDLLFDNTTIELLYKSITDTKSVISQGSILKYDFEKDTQIYYKANHQIWIHGTIFERKFLVENNIQFDSNSNGEDTNFINKVYLYSNLENLFMLDNITLIWTNMNPKRISVPEFQRESYLGWSNAVSNALKTYLTNQRKITENIEYWIKCKIIFSFKDFRDLYHAGTKEQQLKFLSDIKYLCDIINIDYNDTDLIWIRKDFKLMLYIQNEITDNHFILQNFKDNDEDINFKDYLQLIKNLEA